MCTEDCEPSTSTGMPRACASLITSATGWGPCGSMGESALSLMKSFATSLTQPYCGVNSGFESVGWLDDATTAMSVAMIPLRDGPITGVTPAFGMLVLASPDPQRFASGMGTDFLERMAELGSAALSRLRVDVGPSA